MPITPLWFVRLLAACLLLAALGCGETTSSPPPTAAEAAKTPPLDPNTGSGSLSAPAPEAGKNR